MPSNIPSLIKPTLTTKFKIDFSWWKSQDRNWRSNLQSYLCPEHQLIFANFPEQIIFDIVDPKTGEVSQGDGMISVLTQHCSHQPDFITANAPLVDSIFKTFLANDNQALDSNELSAITGRQAETILKTISGIRVYKGIRPV